MHFCSSPFQKRRRLRKTIAFAYDFKVSVLGDPPVLGFLHFLTIIELAGPAFSGSGPLLVEKGRRP